MYTAVATAAAGGIAAYLGLLLITTGAAKYREPYATAAAEPFSLLPVRTRPFAARVVGRFELALGLWLVSGLLMGASLSVASVSFSAFALVHLAQLAAQRDAGCSCLPYARLRDAPAAVMLAVSGLLALLAGSGALLSAGAVRYPWPASLVFFGAGLLLAMRATGFHLRAGRSETAR